MGKGWHSSANERLELDSRIGSKALRLAGTCSILALVSACGTKTPDTSVMSQMGGNAGSTNPGDGGSNSAGTGSPNGSGGTNAGGANSRGGAGSGGVSSGAGASALGGSSSTSGGASASGGGSSQTVAPPVAVDVTTVAAPSGFTFTSAPAFGAAPKYVANRSSVTFYFPAVDKAQDYRVFQLKDGVSTQIAGTTEDVSGATITCAGLRQRNECDNSQAVTKYGTGFFHISTCSEEVRAVDTPLTVNRLVEVDALSGDGVFALEAIDTLCPFPGAIGAAHRDVPIFGTDKPLQATYQGKIVNLPISQTTFPIRTEDEVRAQYKSLILNGHGHALVSSDPLQGPFWNLAQPALPIQPKVLARAIVKVAPTGTAKLPDGYKSTDIFDDFSDDSDKFTLVAARKDVEATILPDGFGPIGNVARYENSKWNRYTFNGEEAQMYVSGGQLHTVLADVSQDVMASNIIYPKRPVKIPDTDSSYLHVTFETQLDATQRRYWWVHLCGAEKSGKTYSGTALPNDAGIVALPFFMDPASGPTISMAGWNCLQFVPRGGDYDVLTGGDVHNSALDGAGRPETDLRILVNRATPSGQDPLKDTNSVILLDPAMNSGNTQKMGGSWLRTWDDQHTINGMMFDEVMYVGQRTRIDLFINRSRVVVFANGAQKACDNFATHKLTMAEGALGIGHVIYHSSGERTELLGPDWIRTGQNYYLWNTPFVDVRSFDNVGIQEDVALPATFNAAPCFTTPS